MPPMCRHSPRNRSKLFESGPRLARTATSSWAQPSPIGFRQFWRNLARSRPALGDLDAFVFKSRRSRPTSEYFAFASLLGMGPDSKRSAQTMVSFCVAEERKVWFDVVRMCQRVGASASYRSGMRVPSAVMRQQLDTFESCVLCQMVNLHHDLGGEWVPRFTDGGA